MDYQVIFQEPFLEDLEKIVRQVAAENVPAAQSLGELFVRTGESLAFFPERYPRVRHRPELRRCIVAKHYKLFYRLKPGSRSVEVLRCWDGRRGTEPVT